MHPQGGFGQARALNTPRCINQVAVSKEGHQLNAVRLRVFVCWLQIEKVVWVSHINSVCEGVGQCIEQRW